MSIVTLVWSMISAVCLTLGVLYVMVWLSRRDEVARLVFSLAAFGVAGLAVFELLLMHAPSVETYAVLHRWAHVPVFFVTVGTVFFVHLYFRAGALWLLWFILLVRVLVLVVNFSGPTSFNFIEITALAPVSLLGEFVNIPVAVPSPWTRLGELSLLLVVVFVAHAALQSWQRNKPRDRQRALVIGVAVSVFFVFSLMNAILLHWDFVSIPYLLSMAFMFVILAMSYELSVDLLQASRVARELDDSRMRLELAAESSGIGLWDYDATRDRFWVTDRLREIFGFAPDEELRMASWLEKVHPDDYGRVAAQAEATVTAGANFDTEYRLMSPTGRLRWLTAKGRGAPGGNRRFLGVVMDVTTQHEAEHERIQLRENLAHTGRVSMMGLLASSMAHELNQPLGAILRNAEAAQLLLASDSPDLDEIREILRDIQRDDQRAGGVITRLRGLLTGHSLEFQVLDLGSLVDEVLSLVRTEVAVRQVRLVRAIGPADAIVRGDAIHLQQVLLNFVMNALDALVSVDPANREIRIDARQREDGMLEVVVSDTGPGVPAELSDKVFDPFYTTKSTGMGMGLSICRTIIEAHGGRIWVERDRPVGAAFCFTLPLEPEAPGA